MADGTAIEWCDHIDPNATGRTRGAYKSAATKIGTTVDDWIKQRQAGNLWCFRCRSWKPHSVFARDAARRSKRAATCKPCLSDASTAARYGMRLEELWAFRAERGNKCYICGDDGLTYIDHNHVTGKVRGLLCPNCNTAIGRLKESPELLRRALAYLEKTRG